MYLKNSYLCAIIPNNGRFMRRYFLTMALFLAGVMWLNANPVDMNQA